MTEGHHQESEKCRAMSSMLDLAAKRRWGRRRRELTEGHHKERKESRATILLHDLEAIKESGRAMRGNLQKRKRESHSLSLVPSNSVSLSKSPMDEMVVEATETM